MKITQLPKTIYKDVRVSLFLMHRSFTRGNLSLIITPVTIMAVIYINLLFVPAMIQGTINANNNQLTNHLFSNFTVTPPGTDNDIEFNTAQRSQVLTTLGVQAATGTYEAGHQLSQGKAGGRWSVLAIDPNSYYTVFGDVVHDGDLLRPNDNNGIVLGSLIAGNGHESSPTYNTSLKGVTAGEEVEVKLANGTKQKLTIRGVINDNYFLADNRAFMSRDKLEDLVPTTKGRATSVYVKTSPQADQGAIRKQLESIFPNAKIWDTEELSGNVQDTVNTIRAINKVISALSLFVGAITIFIVTYVDLMTRRKQIGIERAVGIRGGSVVLTYMLRAVVCTIAGIGIGSLVFRVAIIPYFEKHPFNFPTGEVSLVYQSDIIFNYLVILMAIAMVAALIPSVRSVRVKLLDAIWG